MSEKLKMFLSLLGECSSGFMQDAETPLFSRFAWDLALISICRIYE
jgi:hypothetical protein